MKKYALFFAGLVIASHLFGAITGKIQGKVKDKATGEPLPFVNVVIEETTMGAASNMEGEYFIINVPVGTYTLSATMMGYKITRVENVKVSADMTTRMDFLLEPTVIVGEEVVVTAERSIVQRDVTSSMKRFETEEIQHMPISDFQGIVAAQAGAVETEGEYSGGLHIRGGRTGEVAYYVDGISVNDPATRQAGINISNMAIQEMLILSGGFNAEYGEAMSGLVNIVTREGSRKFGCDIEYGSDALFGDYNYKYHDVNLSIGGPVPFLKKVSYFLSGEGYINDTYLPNNDVQRIGGTAKLSWKPTPYFKALLNTNYSYRVYHYYLHDYSRGDWLRDQPRRERGNLQVNLQLTHTLSPNTFYTLNIGGFDTYFKASSQNGKDYNDFSAIGKRLPWVSMAVDSGWYDPEFRTWKEDWSGERAWMKYYEEIMYYGYWDAASGKWYWTGKDSLQKLEHAIVALNNRYYEVNEWRLTEDSTDIYYHEFDLDIYLEGVKRMLSDTTFSQDSLYNFMPSGNMYYIRYNEDEFTTRDNARYRYYFRPWWHEHETEHFTVDASITSQVNKYNQIKGGGFFRIHDLTLTDVQFVNSNPYTDHYDKQPITAAGYLQNKLEYEDLTINAGVRFDYFDPRSDFYIKLDSLDAGQDWAEPKYQISPRFGISFAVTDRTKLFANYGHFFQPVALEDIYQNLEADITSGLPLLGNPNLPPEKTIAYEVGVGHAFTPDLSTEVTAYFKDVENLLSTRSMSTFWRRNLVTYTIYKLEDFATISGVDVSLTKRFGLLSGSIAYSYLNAKGTGSSGREFYHRYLNTGIPLPKRAYPLEFDVTHSAKAALNFYLPAFPELSKQFEGVPVWLSVLSDLNANIQFTFASGPPYTPEDLRGTPLEIGSKRLPSYTNFDIRVDKGFKLGNLKYTIFLDVRNVFDTKNVVNIHPETGKPDDDGNPPKWDPIAYESMLDREPYLQRKYAEDPDNLTPEDAYNLYLADYANWKACCDDIRNYSDPRLIRAGVRFSF